MDRRSAIVTGLGILAGASLSRRVLGSLLDAGYSPSARPGDPLLRLPTLGPSTSVGGLPVATTWFGDAFAADALPFHQCESCDGSDPDIDEHVDVVVIGAGLAGLAAAHALRHRRTVLLELRPRVGGNAMGESWRALKWSLGSAYFMRPVRGTTLDALYTSLGVPELVREDASPTTFAWDSAITTDLLGPRPSEEERRGLERYLNAVARYADAEYPEIPFEGKPGASVVELDSTSFRTHVEGICRTVPPRLAYALQAYCASSFGVGDDEISAAAGWNFVAAEEGGRWVMPGGNAGLARALWRGLTPPGGSHGGAGGVSIRVGATATAIERLQDGVCVRWRRADGKVRRMRAQHVVCAAPKHVTRHLIPWLAAEDNAKFDAIEQVHTVPYLVGNVILSGSVPRELYDLFVAGNTQFPMDANEFEASPIITDVVNGSFTGNGAPDHAVLTLYWPLPWHTARFQIVAPDAWRTWAERAARQLGAILPLIGLSASDVLQVRWTRWGHAMPVAPPGWYTSSAPALLRRPLLDRVWFANQDNWLLPAVETSLLEGLDAASRVDAALG